MTDDQLYEIAKIVSNEFNGKRDTFTAKKNGNFWSLTTNACDMAPLIRVYETSNKISTIQVNGDYTDGWKDIHWATWAKIEIYLKSLNKSNGQ